MMYTNNFVAVIKVNGRVLREANSVVHLPFGAEYSILLKNLNTVRALAKVDVDGQPATDNNWLILPAHGSIEIERFIQNNNLNQGNKFKFIERTSEVEQHRGVGAEDGLIRIEFKKEIIYQPIQPPSGVLRTSSIGGSFYNTSNMLPTMDSFIPTSSGGAYAASESVKPANDAGITVAGGYSSQRFEYGETFLTEIVGTVIVLHLKGQVGHQVVQQPITVAYQKKCNVCGKMSKVSEGFCSRCGTSLTLF